MEHADGDVYRPVPGYLRGVWLEVLKADWPSRRATVSLSTVMLTTVAALTTFVVGLDAAFAKVIVSVLT